MRARGKHVALLAQAGMALTGLMGLAHAQTPTVERTGRDAERLDRPEFAPSDPPALDLPRADAEPDFAGLASGPTFLVQKIVVTGATAIPAAAIDGVTQPYVGQTISGVEVLALRDALTELYVERGFVTSGATIPDQDASDGTLRFEIVEGRLDAPVVTGLRHLRSSYIATRMQSPPDEIVRVDTLQSRFQRLIADPNIKRVEAHLAPGPASGRSILSLQVTEVGRFSAEAEIATDRSPSVGGERIAVRANYRNFIGYGERISGEIGRSEGLLDGSVTYSMPVGANGADIYVHADGADAEVIEKPLNELDVISNSWTATVGGGLPLYRRFGRTVSLGFEVSHTQADTELGGIGFSFSPGAVRGRTAVTSGALSQSVVLQGASQVLAARSAFSFGLDANGSPTTASSPRNDFVVWRGQMQFARKTTRSGQQLLASVDGQWTDEPLYVTEKFAFGGLDSVRGYRKNEALGDRGVTGSLEYRVPARDVIPKSGWIGRNLVVGAFLDGGRSWNAVGRDPQFDRAASIGVSTFFRLSKYADLSVSWGDRLEEAPSHQDEGVQDAGVSFRLVVRGTEPLALARGQQTFVR